MVKKIERWTNLCVVGIGRLAGRVSWDNGRKGLPGLLDLLIAAAQPEFRIEPWARDHAASVPTGVNRIPKVRRLSESNALIRLRGVIPK
jgi:hypothetical protein